MLSRREMLKGTLALAISMNIPFLLKDDSWIEHGPGAEDIVWAPTEPGEWTIIRFYIVETPIDKNCYARIQN